MVDIQRTSKRYFKQQLCLVVVTALLSLLVMRVAFMDCLLYPTIISVFFTLFVSIATIKTWKHIAIHSPENLTTFYSASSGFRLLLALATMFVYYLISGRNSMSVFFIVFMVFYCVSLTHHALFFARVTSHS